MKKLLLLFLILFSSKIFSQTLVNSYPFPNYGSYNFLWGITAKNDTLWVGSDYDNLPSIPAKIYKITKTGVILDSLVSPKNFNHGMAWDGTGFWIAEDLRTSGARLYKINTAGVIVDSIYTGTYSQGIGGLAINGGNIWCTVYYPEATSYPFTWAYAFNLTTKLKVDSIPLRCKQAQGIAFKGDTIFYVNDAFNGEPERIFAFRKAVGDTIFSFPGPDPDGDDDPRGMYWDGQNLYLLAQRIGNTASSYSTLYKYSISGGGNPIITAPSTINFGNTILNTPNPQQLTIQNTGTATLKLNSYSISNPRYTINLTTPDSIAAGQQKNYTVTFTPTVYDTTSGVLSIASNDGGTPNKQIKLTGKGVYSGAYLTLSASTYSYGTRRTGCTSGYLFNITNTGSQVLNITSASFAGQRFRLDTVGVTFPIVIDTQKTRQLRVWFNPTSVTSYSDSLTINSNAVNGAVQRLRVSGTASNSLGSIGEILWEGTVPDNPSTGFDDFKPVSIKQINDVNADGINDVLVASQNYFVSCFNGGSSVTSDVLWTFNTGYNNNNAGSVPYEQAMQVRTDIDGDGIQDIVIGCAGGNEEVYTISGRTGKKIWEFGDSVTFSDGDVNVIKVDKDYNGDGVLDVLMDANGTGGNPPGRKMIYILNGLTGVPLLTMGMANTFSYDLVSTSQGFAVGMGESGGPYQIIGFNNTGTQQWTYPSSAVIWGMSVIPSINADTVSDIAVFSGFTSAITVLNAVTGQVIYSQNFGTSINGIVKYSNGSYPGLGFGIGEMMTFNGAKQVVKMNPRDGLPLWNQPVDASYVMGVDIIGPTGPGLLNDNAVACGTLGNNFYILNGNTGAIKFTYSFGNGNTDFACEKVGRLDNINREPSSVSNGNEVVAGCRDGRIKCFSGGSYTTGGILNLSTVEAKYSLEQNYPNPFNPQTKIRFAIPKEGFVKLVIFDVSGREVSQLVNEKLSAGTYEAEFSGVNLSSGTYFYKIEAGNFVETKKMILVK
ncbi:MAG: choice-of-anchor D domain-containing protein [Bacteroidetes bacterium]|nr:choice-of-anchor D domain-containing protein [Bacteroidota bacterium]